MQDNENVLMSASTAHHLDYGKSLMKINKMGHY